MKGQTSLEMMLLVSVVLLMFLSAYIGVIKRGEDINTFGRDITLQNAVERTSSYITAVHGSTGLRINATLPTVQGCTPVYTVHDRRLIATCGNSAFTSRFMAANVTNGTSQTPFTVSGDISIANNGGTVVIT